MLKAEFDRVKKDMKDMVKSQPTEEAEEVETE